MGRGKLKMELIENEKARMITYQKRKKGLKKKVEEFSILCDVDTCMIIFGPEFNNRPVDIETWPSDPTEIQRIIKRYRSQSEDKKKNQDLSHFLESRKKKLDDEITKLHKAKFPAWDNRLDNMELNELSSLSSSLESKIRATTDRILKKKGETYNNSGSINNNYLNMFGSRIINNNPTNNHMPMPMATTTAFGNALHQNASCNWNQFDNQMIPINVNPMTNPRLMMLMMGNNSQFVGESSGSNRVKEQVGASNFGLGNDQTLGAHQAMSYYDVISARHHIPSSMQSPALTLPNVSHQNIPISQFSEFYNTYDDLEMRDRKRKFQT